MRGKPEADPSAAFPMLHRCTAADLKAAEAALDRGTATSEQIALVSEYLGLFFDKRFNPLAASLDDANKQSREIFARMKSDGLSDFSEYIAANPPNALTILALVRYATAVDSDAAKQLMKSAMRKLGSIGGKANRKDPRAREKADVLNAWRARDQRKWGNNAKAWTEKMALDRAIRVAPRTAALWIRAAEPKKKRQNNRPR